MGQVLCYRGCKSLLFFSVLGLLFFSSCQSTRSFTSPLPEEYSIRMSKSSASGYKNVKRVRKYELHTVMYLPRSTDAGWGLFPICITGVC